MTGENPHVNNGENEMRVYTVMEIDPMGFGNAAAKISYDKKLKSDKDFEARAEVGAEIIKSGECMYDITDRDDGCIDGRKANFLLFPLGIEGQDYNEVPITNPAEHRRAKVAGGGYITSTIMNIALGGNHNQTIEDVIAKTAEHLTEQGIYCGTHTGLHMNDECTDCGANDRMDEIVQAMVTYKGEIRKLVDGTLSLVAGGGSDSISDPIIDAADESVASVASNEGYFVGSSGISRFKKIMTEIMAAQKRSGIKDKPVAVSKHLSGEHQEAFIILNMVEGKTFSQVEFKKAMTTRFPDDDPDSLPQAFAVDIPRIIELARAMAHGRDDDEASFQTALYAGLAYQFATAAVLTDGSLRTFVVQ